MLIFVYNFKWQMLKLKQITMFYITSLKVLLYRNACQGIANRN